MQIERHYALQAADAREYVLEGALADLATAINKLEGCLGARVLRKTGNSQHFLFVETWASAAAYEGARGKLPKGAFDAVLGAIVGSPSIEKYEQALSGV
jgi:quinol monooxygenase YgiN